jgi:hypothetical protein
MSMLFYNVFQPDGGSFDPSSPHISQQSDEEYQAKNLPSHNSSACKAAVWIGPRADGKGCYHMHQDLDGNPIPGMTMLQGHPLLEGWPSKYLRNFLQGQGTLERRKI